MAETVTYLDPGGDADFGTGLGATPQTLPTVATDFVHGTHVKSYKFATGSGQSIGAQAVLSDTGSRVSFWMYMNAKPTNSIVSLFDCVASSFGSTVFGLRMSSGGILRLYNSNVSAQIGSDGATLAIGGWHHILISWVITSGSVNQINVYVDEALSISTSNNTLSVTGSSDYFIGNISADSTFDIRISDIYVAENTTVGNTGAVWVTAKRPFANGTTNNFTAGGSAGSYGSGNARYVNERPVNTTDIVSVTPTTVQTEEYSIENESVGDFNIIGSQILDFMGWIDAKVASTSNSPVMKIIVAGTATTKTLTTSNAFYRQMAGSQTYPAGGTDIGMSAQYTTTGHLVTLNECGIVVAYIPGQVQIVQTAQYAGASSLTTEAFTLPHTPTVGNLLIFIATWWTGDGPLVTPSGWNLFSDYEPTNKGGVAVFWRTVQSGDTASWTLTYDTVSDENSGFMLEIAGAVGGSPSFNQLANSTNASAATSLATGSVTPSVLNCLAIAVFVSVAAGGSDGTSISAGWTKMQAAESSFQPGWLFGKNALTADTITAISTTISGMPSADPSSAIILIGPTAAAGGTPTDLFFAVL